MRSSKYALVILMLSVSLFAFAQDNLENDLDLTELDEFGEEAAPKAKEAAPDASADEFDLENPSQENAKDANPDDLEKELESLDEEPAKEAKPAEELPELETPTEEAAKPPVEAPAPEVTQEEPAAPVPPPEPVAETPAPVAEPVQPITDEPNAELEARLNRIFEKFMSAPTTDEEWLQIAGEKSSETYAVQPGDTLWDISVTFFGNGNFWPKIWQLNDDITNPHIIQPGRVIKFTPGTLSQAPSMQVADAEAEMGEPEAPAEPNPNVAEAAPEPEEAPIPPAPARPPVVNPIPDSLPLIVGSSSDQYDEDGFAIEKQKVGELDPVVTIQSVLTSPPLEVGKVVGIEMDRADTAGVYQYVFVEVQGARVGDEFTVYDLGPEISYDSKGYGRVVAFAGKIKIVEDVEGTVDNLYKALVVESYDQVRKGGILTRETLPKVQLSGGGDLRSVPGEIIGGPGRSERKLFSDRGIAFLNIGTSQGVKTGDILNIVRNELRRNPDSVIKKSSGVIGQIKIGQVAENTSTGIVLNSKEALQIGDLVATGIVMSKAPTGTPGDEATPEDLDLGNEQETPQPADEVESDLEDIQ